MPLRDFLIDDNEPESAIWSKPGNNVVGNMHHVGGAAVFLDHHNFVVTNVTHDRIVDMLADGYDIDLYLHAETAALARWV